MDVSRRVVLGGMLAPLIAQPGLLLGQSSNAQSLIVILDHIGAGLSPEGVEAVLDIFFARGIPVTVPMRCGAESAGLVARLKKIALRERGLLEIALQIDGLGGMERYFQLRAAIDMRDCLSVASEDPVAGAAPVISVLDRSDTSSPDLYALRAAGFRVLLQPMLGGEDQGGFQAVDWGVASLTSAISATLAADPARSAPRFDRGGATQAFYLSFEAAATLDMAAVLAQATKWADWLQKSMLEDALFLTRPMDHLLQGNPGASNYIGIVLDITENTGPDAPIFTLARKLDVAEIPYTMLADNGLAEKGEIPTFADPEICQIESSNAARCVAVMAGDHASRTPLAEIILTRDSPVSYWSGPRADGRFHAFPLSIGTEGFAEMMAQDPLTDRILLIDGAELAAPIQQDALVRQFLQAKWDGKAGFYTLDGYMQQTLTPDAVLNRVWSSRRRQASDPRGLQVLSLAETLAFEKDARLAWSFIARYSDENTGICGGTVQSGTGEIVNQWVSLWDVASQLQGILAAVRIGLIEASEGKTRVALVLANLPTVVMGGAALPPALFRADAPNQSRPEFNACDTGRFLIALSALAKAGLLVPEQAESLVAQWDISRVLRAQHPYDFNNGRWEFAANSHCTQYSRNGYIAWGFSVDPVYPALEDRESGDQCAGLLYAAANIGHFGTEPLLLEGLEIGYSRETAYLSEVLFDAQLSWFEQTGQYKCVSETPLNFEPWFSYQGLRVDRRAADSWVVSTPSNLARYNTAEFAARADILSAKAAYLWVAEYPHAYSNAVLALIREKARLRAGFGFSVGLSVATMQAIPDYSDVNTNGIILTAIAKILRAR